MVETVVTREAEKKSALAAAVWALTAAGELAAMTIPAKIVWGKLSYLGITSVSLFWFLFARGYSQRARWLTRWRLALLGVIPVVSLLLALTNEWHHLIWPRITPISDTPGSALKQGSTFWFTLPAEEDTADVAGHAWARQHTS